MIFWERTGLPVLMIDGRLALSDLWESAIMYAPDASQAVTPSSHGLLKIFGWEWAEEEQQLVAESVRALSVAKEDCRLLEPL